MKRTLWILLASVGGLGLVIALQNADSIQQRQLVQNLLRDKACVGCDLHRADLAGLDLSGVNLKAANLEGANLKGAQLSNTILTNANLQNADLTDANLGCTTVNFNLNADQQTANVDLTVDAATPAQIQQQEHILNFNLDADGNGTTMQFNFGGCAAMNGANLTGATLPDGSVYR
jgi:uncharacterized protein YjbI with pentapeptide repeats